MVTNSITAATGHVTVGGVALEYRWFGDAAGPPIVMLHEGLGSVAVWKDFPEQLSRTMDSSVLAYSRRGYGKSDPLTQWREPEYMHIEGEVVLPALLDALGIEAATLMGHSDGASIALLFAAAHPTRALGLILEAPHVFVEPITVKSIAEAKVTYETTDLSRKLGRYHDDVESAFWGWNKIWLDPRFLEWNIEDILPHVSCPTLMIQGLQDEYGTQAQLDAISAKVPRSEVVLLDNCGHSPHRDQPAMTLAAIETFLKRDIETGR